MDTAAGTDAPWTWLDDRRFVLRGEQFVAGSMPMGIGPGDLHVIKPPELTARYLGLIRSEAPKRVVEIGIKDGGSTAMIALLAEPELLLAVELAPEVPAALQDFLRRRDLAHQVVTAFGLSQADREQLRATVDRHRSGEPLDLVIDDASHVLEPTRTSFEVLFPRLRPGGLYVIEDWASECTVAESLSRHLGDAVEVDRRLDAVNQVLHTLNAPGGALPPAVVEAMQTFAARADADGRPTPDLWDLIVQAAASADLDDLLDQVGGPVRPVADLAVELTMIAAMHPDVVAEVQIDSQWMAVRRGPADLPIDGFRLADRWTDHFGYLPG